MKASNVGSGSWLKIVVPPLAIAIVTLVILRQALGVPGLLYYSDYSLPLSLHDALAMLARYSSLWDAHQYLGRPNTIFFGTQIFIGAYAALAFIMGPEPASKAFIVILLFAGGLGMWLTLRKRLGTAGATCSAILYIANPWTFEQVAQGHIYLLEVLWLLPWLVYKAASPSGWRKETWLAATLGCFLLIACDYHFAMLIFGACLVECLAIFAARLLPLRELVLRASSVALAILLASVFTVPYIVVLRSILSENAPGVADLLYFSHYTSYFSAVALLRPLMNSGDALSRLGPLYAPVWYASFLGIALCVILVALARAPHDRDARRITRVLIALTALAVVCGAGASGPTGPLIIWAYVHIPFAAVFRDPSKFFIIPLLLYCWVVAVVASTRSTVAAVLTAAYVVPFVVAGNFLAAGLVYPPQDSALLKNPSRALAFDQSYTSTPPWNFVQYSWLSNPIHDPMVLYPRGSYVGIDYDYDNSEANMYLRWLFGQLYFQKTNHFDALARTIGLARIISRPLATAVTGDAAETAAFQSPRDTMSLAQQLRLRRVLRPPSSTVEMFEVADSAGMRMDSRIYEIVGNDRDVISALAELGESFRHAGPCFATECPKNTPRITAGFLSDSIGASGIKVDLRTALDGRSGSSGFYLGSQRWVMMYGSLNAYRNATLYENGGFARGKVAFGNLDSRRHYRVRAHVMTASYFAKIVLSCGNSDFTGRARPAAVLSAQRWIILGDADARDLKRGCDLRVWSPEAAVLDVVADDGQTAEPAPDIALERPTSTFISSSGKLQDRQGAFENTRLRLIPGQSITMHVPVQLWDRHIWLHVNGNDGAAVLVGEKAFKLSGKRYEWLDAGSNRTASVSIAVTSGTVDVDLLAYARNGIEIPLQTARAPRFIHKSLDGFTVQHSGIVSFAEAGDQVWRLDGQPPSGRLAGFGQIYVVSAGTHRFSNTLESAYRLGVVITLVGVALLALGFIFGFRQETASHVQRASANDQKTV